MDRVGRRQSWTLEDPPTVHERLGSGMVPRSELLEELVSDLAV